MFQKIIVVGRLGRDPEMRYTPAGQAVTTFSLATDRQWIGEDGVPVKVTTWFKVSAWGKQAENCNNYLAKGKLVLVEGILNCDPKTGGPRIWKGQDDLAHAGYEITASSVKFLSPHSESLKEEMMAGEEVNVDPAGDDIPF